ncbi:MAG: cyclase family protein [Chloroflexia bacterium]|nr:cyclase family protein [Chloroflexia bacterium]
MCSPRVMGKVREELSRRRMLGMVGVAVAAGVASRLPASAQQATPMAATPGTLNLALGSYTQVQDLTHTITPTTPLYPGYPQPEIEPLRTFAENGFYANLLTYGEHTGTHMDAPAHFVEGAPFANELPVEQFFAPLAVIDISERAAGDPDAQLMPDDILAWEDEHGALPAGAFVAMNAGWDVRIDDPEAFINMSDDVLHFPGFHPDATALLIDERDVTGIGVDTLSLDYGAATEFATHVTLLQAGKYGLECIAGLANVPAAGGLIVVGGPKFMNASGGPSRVMALF